MIVGINLLYLIPGKVGGTETYARELILAFSRILQEHTYFIFVNNNSCDWIIPSHKNFTKVICPIDATSRVFRYYYEQFIFPQLLLGYRLDILHSLGYVGPIKVKIKHVVTIHDANFVGHGNNMALLKRTFLRYFIQLLARKIDKVITVSAFSKAELVKYLTLDASKVKVIYEASFLNSNFVDDDYLLTVRNRFDIPKNYVIAFSSFNEHKNVRGLIEAIRLINHPPICLVLVGNVHDADKLVKYVFAAGIEDRVIITGYVSEVELAALLKGALIFVFPSLYEGFGLPILEAQSVGTCVLSSKQGALPEIGMDSVEYFNSSSPAEMSESIVELLRDKGRVDELVNRGWQNVRRFSWQKAAEETLAVYTSIVQ